jgi:hypothetical protein
MLSLMPSPHLKQPAAAPRRCMRGTISPNAVTRHARHAARQSTYDELSRSSSCCFSIRAARRFAVLTCAAISRSGFRSLRCRMNLLQPEDGTHAHAESGTQRAGRRERDGVRERERETTRERERFEWACQRGSNGRGGRGGPPVVASARPPRECYPPWMGHRTCAWPRLGPLLKWLSMATLEKTHAATPLQPLLRAPTANAAAAV